MMHLTISYDNLNNLIKILTQKEYNSFDIENMQLDISPAWGRLG